MKEEIVLELRKSEGGKDSELLIKDMAATYKKTAKIKNFTFQISKEKIGYISLYL